MLSHVKSHNINAEVSCQNRPRSIYQYSTMDTRLPGKTAIFLVSQSPRDLAWMQVKHHQLWKPENFGAMLEKRYDIERGLLRSFLSIARVGGAVASWSVRSTPERETLYSHSASLHPGV